MLDVRNVTKKFGGLVAVNDVSLTVQKGEIFGLIGPNGAGKTTLFNLIAGAFPPDEGAIEFEGRSTVGLPSNAICQRGLARTFQIPQIFPSMSVGETIAVAAMLHHRALPDARALAAGVADRVGLGARTGVPTGSLTNAEKKRLEVARALATTPRMILLDEVLAGLNASEISGVLELIKKLRSEGVTVLFVEHNLEAVLGICDRIAVLDYGRKIAEGLPRSVLEHPDVVRAYLGDQVPEASHA